jgi:N4-gp56 family major capsid protein
MANEITSTTTASDQEKFLASKLISRSLQKLVAATACDKVPQKKGAGLTAYFIRYRRMNVPLVPLTEGSADPANSSFSLDQVTVTLDQWGDVITLTDVSELTTSHPLLQQATELLSDNAQRVIDREIQIVWLAGTNVQYGDGSVTARNAITSSMKATDATINKAYVTLALNGAPPRGGPSGGQVVGGAGSLNSGMSYLGICGVEIIRDVMATGTSLGTWASVAMYANQKALYNNEVGQWLGIRWVETNFIPRFKILGNTTAAVVSGNSFGTDTPVVTAVDGGGTLTSSTTFFYKVTRKDLTRGFEEDISIPHSTASTATGNNESFTFNFSSSHRWVRVQPVLRFRRAGGTGTDATLKLHTQNIAVGTTITVTANPTGATAPANIKTDGSVTAVHVAYIHGNESCNWVSLQNLEVIMSDPQKATVGNALRRFRTLGYKFMAKAMIRDSTRLLRMEVASAYST